MFEIFSRKFFARIFPQLSRKPQRKSKKLLAFGKGAALKNRSRMVEKMLTDKNFIWDTQRHTSQINQYAQNLCKKKKKKKTMKKSWTLQLRVGHCREWAGRFGMDGRRVTWFVYRKQFVIMNAIEKRFRAAEITRNKSTKIKLTDRYLLSVFFFSERLKTVYQIKYRRAVIPRFLNLPGGGGKQIGVVLATDKI